MEAIDFDSESLEIRPDGKHGQAVPAHAELQKHGLPSRRMEGRDTHADRISPVQATTSLPESRWRTAGSCFHKQSCKVNDINTDIYWFYGKESRLFARYLSFAVAGTFSTENWIPGSAYKGALCFYNGTGTCRRALFRESVPRKKKFCRRAASNLKQAAAVYRTTMLTNPFFEDVPPACG